MMGRSRMRSAAVFAAALALGAAPWSAGVAQQ